PRVGRFGMMTPFTPWWAPRPGSTGGSATGPWLPDDGGATAADDAPSQGLLALSATGSVGGGGIAPRRRDDGPPPFDPPRGQAYYRWVAEVGRQAAEALGHAHR